VPHKMTAAEIIYTALVWADEGLTEMINGLDDGEPHRVECINVRKQLHAYRRRRFGPGKNPFEGCKLVSLDELRANR
jgi:hypothetical protein